MKGNPTAGILLLVLASLFVTLGTKYGVRIREAFSTLVSGNSATGITDSSGTTYSYQDLATYWKASADALQGEIDTANKGKTPAEKIGTGGLKTDWATIQANAEKLKAANGGMLPQ